jgi:hypothetical protein
MTYKSEQITNTIKLISQTLVNCDPKISQFNTIMAAVTELGKLADEKVTCEKCQPDKQEENA